MTVQKQACFEDAHKRILRYYNSMVTHINRGLCFELNLCYDFLNFSVLE